MTHDSLFKSAFRFGVVSLLFLSSPLRAQEPVEEIPEASDPQVESIVPEGEVPMEEEALPETEAIPQEEALIPEEDIADFYDEDVAPESFPAPEGSTPDMGSAPDIYIVETGDTLWDICEKFLGNPWYWPKLWSLNQYIENPHLIYPGNQIRFYGGSEIAPPALDIAGAGDMARKPVDEVPAVAEPAEKKAPGVVETIPEETKKVVSVKLRSLAFISEKELKTAGRITHSGDPIEHLVTGNRAYLEFKDRRNVSIGDRFHVIERVKKVDDPNSIFGKLGVLIKRKAVIKIIGVYSDTIEGTVTDAEDSVSRGDRLVPYQSTVRRLIPHNTTKKITGNIVEAENQQYLISNNDFVFLNLGKTHGVDDGLQLLVVRQGDGVFQGDDKHLPDVIVGRLLIVEARGKTSTAYVTDLRDSLAIGDRVVSTMQ